jgi:ABC-type siderophore export system fused ATPase/permease subunit
MSPEPTSEMNANIVKRVRNYLILFVSLTLLNIWGDKIVEIIMKNIDDKDKAELTNLIVKSIIAILTGLIMFLLTLGRDLDLHNIIDKLVFRVRKRTDEIILREMIKSGETVEARNVANMNGKDKEVIYLFYHFINKQDVLKALAFTYWENYFVNIYIGLFSAIFFIITTIISLIRWKLDIFAAFPLFFLFLLIVIFLSTKYSLLKKIYDLPIQPIKEILSNEANELRKQIETRF